MSDEEILEPWKELARCADERSPQEVEQLVGELSPRDVGLAISRLSEAQRTRVLTVLTPEHAAELVAELPDVQVVALFENLQPEIAAAILDNLPSDEQADLIGDLDAPDAEAILERMDPEEAADARTLSRYADNVAGGLMVTEFLTYPEDYTVDNVIADMREHSDKYRDYDVQYAYVCRGESRLTGVLRLRDLLLASRQRPIAELMIREPVSVRDSTNLDDLVVLFDHHHFLGVPVVDEGGNLLGVVQKEAVDEAQGERQESDFLKTQGIVGGEEIRTMPVLLRSRRRLAWLSVNILLNCVAASVIALFQETLSAVIALAVFLPIISDMSGCSGNQAVAVSLRELSLGLLRPAEVLRVWLLEVSVGLINGIVLGLLVGVVAWAWQGNLYLGLVVGVSLCLNTMVAVSIGGVVPLLLKRCRMDPAIASAPILTTITDMCGFFLILGIATLLLPKLTGF